MPHRRPNAPLHVRPALAQRVDVVERHRYALHHAGVAHAEHEAAGDASVQIGGHVGGDREAESVSRGGEIGRLVKAPLRVLAALVLQVSALDERRAVGGTKAVAELLGAHQLRERRRRRMRCGTFAGRERIIEWKQCAAIRGVLQ